MSEACKHRKAIYDGDLLTSATPVRWTCPDCGARGTAEVMEYLDLDAPKPRLSAISSELSAIGSDISALSSEPEANMSPQLLALSHRLMALGLNLMTFGLWLRSPKSS